MLHTVGVCHLNWLSSNDASRADQTDSDREGSLALTLRSARYWQNWLHMGVSLKALAQKMQNVLWKDVFWLIIWPKPCFLKHCPQQVILLLLSKPYSIFVVPNLKELFVLLKKTKAFWWLNQTKVWPKKCKTEPRTIKLLTTVFKMQIMEATREVTRPSVRKLRGFFATKSCPKKKKADLEAN